MGAVAEIADPGFKDWGIVLSDGFTVRLDGCLAGNGGPFAGRLEEGEVDVGVFVQVV